MSSIFINPWPTPNTTTSQVPPTETVESFSNLINRVSKEHKSTASSGLFLANLKILEANLDLILQQFPTSDPSKSNLIASDELKAASQKVLSTSAFTKETCLQKFQELQTSISKSIAQHSKELYKHKAFVKKAFGLLFSKLGKKHLDKVEYQRESLLHYQTNNLIMTSFCTKLSNNFLAMTKWPQKNFRRWGNTSRMLENSLKLHKPTQVWILFPKP